MEKKEMPSVCFIDDEEMMGEICTELLGSHYLLKTFSSAEIALEEIKKGYRPRVIVTDLRMPNLNGYQFIEKLKQIEISVPTIVISGNMNGTDAWNLLNRGIFSCLEKPFSFRDLQKKINLAMERQQFLVSEVAPVGE